MDTEGRVERLAATGQWQSLIAQLPVTAEPEQVCRVIGSYPQEAPHVRIAATLVALDGATATTDLTGDDLLTERDLPVRALIGRLARPGTIVTDTAGTLDASTLAAGVHSHEHSDDWVQPVRRTPFPPARRLGPG